MTLTTPPSLLSTAAATALLLLAASTIPVHAADGPALSTGAVNDGNFIIEAVSTLILPELPNGNQGDLSLWVGMGTSKGDLIQSIADSYAGGDWTVFAYTLMETSATSQAVVEGPTQAVQAGDYVTMHYKFDDATGNYTQTVVVNNSAVSTLSTSDGEAQGWGSAVECAATDCGTVPEHSWVNTTITLNSTDAGYIDTLALGDGVTGEMVTSDGGKTWSIERFTIPEYAFADSA